MINKIIAFSIKNKFIVGLLTLALIGGGIYSMSTVNLGSVPDITNNQVQVMTVAPNLATKDIEQFVTYPVELAMGNLPGVKGIRSVSRFGLSVVTIVFEDEMGIYKPRQLVSEKLSEVRGEIPKGFGEPFMGPITTGLGEIYQYSIDPKPGYEDQYSLKELRTIQDWIVKRQMTMIEGVIGVNNLGGKVKQYEVALNPEKLNALDVSISDVFEALKRNNLNSGGAYIERNNMSTFIKGEGLIGSLDEIRKIVVKNEGGIPITIADVAKKVHFGTQVRYGAFTHDGKEAVGGIVLMLKGANPNTTIQRVKKRMKEIEKSLPEGLEINAYYDRSELIGRTVDTISTNLIEGALIVVFVLILLLGSLRGGLITASVIPLSLLFAFILMKIFGVWANLMSLGAIDFGIIVDGAVIIVEGTVLGIEQRIRKSQKRIGAEEMDKIAYDSGSTMMHSAFFGQVIILLIFAPILFLQGVSGKMFHPMAYTFGFAVLGAILLCLTYVPMISALVMRPIHKKRNWLARFERFIEKLSSRIIRGLHRLYQPLLKGALKFRLLVLFLALLLFGGAFFTFSNMGGEFIPQLDEGDITMAVMVRQGSSMERMVNVDKRIEKLLLENFPEVKTVAARSGSPGIPTDPMPMDIADMYIILEKDKDQWVSADSKDELIDKIRDLINDNFTGVNLAFTQPIEMRFDELMSGVKASIAVKLFGPNFDVLAKKGQQMAEIIQTIPGVSSATAERISGLPQITVDYNREKIAQYGLDIKKLNTYISTAFAGGKAGVVFEEGRRFDLVVRFAEKYRNSIEDLRSLYVDLPDGTQIPIKAVADISIQPGPMQISRENTFRRTYVGVNTSGRDIESVVNDIKKKLDAQLNLPPGYHITYGGEFKNLQQATNRLQIVVPIALFLIFILLYFALKSFAQAVMIYMAIPLAAIGGVFFLAIRGMPFSISAGVGFIVLFGVAVLNGLVLMNRFNSLKEEGVTNLKDRILKGADERLRPVLLTATAAIAGFFPMAFSTSSGAEVQRPLATVVIGGLVTATFLTLIVVPILYSYVEERQERRKSKKMNLNNLKVWAVLLIGSGLFTWPMSVNAQETPLQDHLIVSNLPSLSLKQAQERAVENYPSLKTAQLRIEKQKALKKTAWDFGRTTVYTGEEEFGNGMDGIQTTIGIQQGQIDIFGIAPTLKLQKERAALATDALQLTKLQVKLKVSKAWGQAYAAKKTYAVYQRLDSVFDGIRRAADIRLEVEGISKLEYLALKNQANTVRLQKKQAYSDYLVALQQLNRWLVSDTLFSVTDVPPTQIAKPFVLKRDSIAQHPLLSMTHQRIEVADALLSKRKSAFLPKLQGQFGWQKIGGQTGFYSYQIGISIPLFYGPARGRTQAAKIEREIAEAKLNQTQFEINTAYQQAKARYLKWKKSWVYYRDEALPLAQKQKEGAILAYQAGGIDYVTFLQNIRNAIQIEVEAWKTFDQYLESRYRLNYYLN